MTSRPRWVRADGKRPIRTTGSSASTTDASTWSAYTTAANSVAGDGIGFMLGDGIGCYDLDHVTDDDARAIAASIPERIIYTERSVSGEGVHIFVEASEGPGTKKWRGEHERYTRQRFIRLTGQTIRL